MARTFKIGDDGDLEFSAGSPVMIDRAEALAQAVRSRLRVILGEWFLDTSIGLPLEKSLTLIEAQVRAEVEAVEGIDTVTSIALEVDGAARELTVTLLASGTTGEALEIAETF